MAAAAGDDGGVEASAPAAMLAALAHPQRLRLLAAIADAGEGGCRVDALRDGGLPEKQLRRHLARLTQAGLVDSDGALVVARLDRMQQAEDMAAADSDMTAEVGAYLRRGRLVDVPRAPEVRRRVLVEIARRFDAERTYSEPEINAALRELHEDHAALRRYMIDFGILERDARGTSYRLAGPEPQ
ncbi:MAG: hypothetical protein QOE31_2093 [Solirubrobacteraceae bacterium]|jgi:hypothetical protein|nr:hypothetical protein [Solirubrobacteraceae bacterium]